MIIQPPNGTSIRKIADATPRLRPRVRVATAQEPGVTVRTSA
jgi:hypothetical protein